MDEGMRRWIERFSYFPLGGFHGPSTTRDPAGNERCHSILRQTEFTCRLTNIREANLSSVLSSRREDRRENVRCE